MAIQRDLGGDLDLFGDFPERPPEMHLSRYERMRARGEAAEAASIAALRAWLEHAEGMTARAAVRLT